MLNEIKRIFLELMKTELITLIPIVIEPFLESCFNRIIKVKKVKQKVIFDTIKLMAIYILYPFIMISIFPSIVSVNILLVIKLYEIRYQLFVVLKLYLLFCMVYILIFCTAKIIAFIIDLNLFKFGNTKIFVLSIVSLVFSKFYEDILIEKEILFFGNHTGFMTKIYSFLCVSITPLIIFVCCCYFLKRMIFIRKRLLNFTQKWKKRIWWIICAPLILELLAVEYLVNLDLEWYNYQLWVLHFVVLTVLFININIFYIFRPQHAIVKEIFYDICLKNGREYTHVLYSNFIHNGNIIRVNVNDMQYFMEAKEIETIRKYEEEKFILLNKLYYIVKCILVCIIEIVIFYYCI